MNVKLFAYALIFVSLFLFVCNGCGEKVEDQIQTVEQLLESKHRLEYNEDGSFRVMTVSDTHMNVDADEDEVQGISNRIKTLVDRVEPNLIIFTGDNTINSYTKKRLRKNIAASLWSFAVWAEYFARTASPLPLRETAHL